MDCMKAQWHQTILLLHGPLDGAAIQVRWKERIPEAYQFIHPTKDGWRTGLVLAKGNRKEKISLGRDNSGSKIVLLVNHLGTMHLYHSSSEHQRNTLVHAGAQKKKNP